MKKIGKKWQMKAGETRADILDRIGGSGGGARRVSKKAKTNVSKTGKADSTASDNREEVTENKKDPKYYADKLPKSEEDFKISNELIKESMYQAGVIYREYLAEYEKSTQLFMGLLSRFPYDEASAPLAYYSVYLNHQEVENYHEAEITKSLLLNNFPNSIYASILTKHNFQEELAAKKDKKEENYQLIHQSYLSNEYQKVIQQTNELQQDKYKIKYMFLRAVSYAGIKDTANLLSNLTAIVELKLEDEVSAEAEYLLKVIQNPAAMQKANEQALAESPYLYRSNTIHMALLILPKKEVDINYLKTLISDYHAIDFENEVFEISAMMMGLDQHLLMVKTFTNVEDAMLYNQLLKSNTIIINEINKSDYKILAISMENFKEFYKNKDVEGYYNFFKKNYLNNN